MRITRVIKRFFGSKKTRRKFNYIPLTMNTNRYGKLLGKFKFRKFNYIPLTMNTNRYGKLLLGKKFEFYLLKINSVRKLQRKPILNVFNINSIYLYKDKYIILNNDMMVGSAIKRSVYCASTGIFLENVVDFADNKNRFFRKRGNIVSTVVNNKVTRRENAKKFHIYWIFINTILPII